MIKLMTFAVFGSFLIGQADCMRYCSERVKTPSRKSVIRETKKIVRPEIRQRNVFINENSSKQLDCRRNPRQTFESRFRSPIFQEQQTSECVINLSKWSNEENEKLMDLEIDPNVVDWIAIATEFFPGRPAYTVKRQWTALSKEIQNNDQEETNQTTLLEEVNLSSDDDLKQCSSIIEDDPDNDCMKYFLSEEEIVDEYKPCFSSEEEWIPIEISSDSEEASN